MQQQLAEFVAVLIVVLVMAMLLLAIPALGIAVLLDRPVQLESGQ